MYTTTTTKGVILPTRALHRALWRWLDTTGATSKGDWPGWERNGGNITTAFMDCFACQVSTDHAVCPLSGLTCYASGPCAGGNFRRWARAAWLGNSELVHRYTCAIKNMWPKGV